MNDSSATALAEALDCALGLQVVETSGEAVHFEECRTEK